MESGVGGVGGCEAKGQFFCTFEQKAAILCFLKGTSSHSSLFRLIRSLVAV